MLASRWVCSTGTKVLMYALYLEPASLQRKGKGRDLQLGSPKGRPRRVPPSTSGSWQTCLGVVWVVIVWVCRRTAELQSPDAGP